jgi:glycosyltransferase involved in cell wall biosynthesis
LNEGVEVFRTVKSIRESVGDAVDIILVDDASVDGTPYKVVANTFDCRYIRNGVRQGVASARDIGVAAAKTDYCILLDAHMRFDKHHDWLGRIIEEVDKDPERIYCTGCVSVWYPFKTKTTPPRKDNVSTAAYLAVSFEDWHTTLEPKWIPLKLKGVEEIPIVLGATYAFDKKYYNKLRGLKGLLSYGSDEAWLSLKSWAIGNGCAVICDVAIGHLFRDKHPYKAPHIDTVYNKMLIASVIFPNKKKWMEHLEVAGGPRPVEAIKRNKRFIEEMATWFASVEKPGWRKLFCELNSEYTDKMIML